MTAVNNRSRPHFVSRHRYPALFHSRQRRTGTLPASLSDNRDTLLNRRDTNQGDLLNFPALHRTYNLSRQPRTPQTSTSSTGYTSEPPPAHMSDGPVRTLHPPPDDSLRTWRPSVLGESDCNQRRLLPGTERQEVDHGVQWTTFLNEMMDGNQCPAPERSRCSCCSCRWLCW